jgi:hypothetical protein
VRFLGQAEVGFFVAVVLVTMVARWFEAIQVVIAKRWTYIEEPEQRRTLLWALPVVLFLHSGPWAAAVFVFLLWQLASGPGDLRGFVWGLIAGASFMVLLIATALVRVRRRRHAAVSAA